MYVERREHFLRQRNKPWADDFIKQHPDIIISTPSKYKGQWNKLFGNSNPIHLEIGTGKGQFITGMAKQFPNINFIGIELAKSIIVSAAQKVIDSEQKNVLLLNENAMNIRDIFANQEISTIYLNFSDPWPKNRHEKRRLTYKTFLDQYKTIIQKNGELILKTDNRSLFEYSLVSLSQFGMVLRDVTLHLHLLDDPENVKTEYEEKFSAKGQPIYRLKAMFP